MHELLPSQLKEWSILFGIAISAVFGALGGCTAASIQSINNDKPMQFMFLLAYLTIGASMGIVVGAYGHVFFDAHDPLKLIGHALVAGIIGATLMAGGHVSARWFLDKLGIEVTITARKKDQERRGNTQG